MTIDPRTLSALIDNAEVDWLTDALHTITGLCAHNPGMLADLITETIRYELTDIEGES